MGLTYPDVGASRGDQLPGGYRQVRRRVRVGDGEAAFRSAAAALSRWEMHRRAGLRVRADGPATIGRRMASGAGIGPLRVWAPVEVVWLVDDPDRYGFGYGTLRGHPESGEEAFELYRDEADQVWFVIRAFSRPRRWYAKVGGPLLNLVQDRITDRYVRAMRELATLR